MKVFLSWSKDPSKQVAQLFARWLPRVIQECSDPFISTDTTKGDPWFETITSAMEGAKVGIVFITAENSEEPWLNFESGALITQFGKTRLCPVLVNMKEGDYSGPLKNLQLTELGDRDDVYALLQTINRVCENTLNEDVLKSTFDLNWGFLAAELAVMLKGVAPAKAKRGIDDKVDELLETVRELVRVQQPVHSQFPSYDPEMANGAIAKVAAILARSGKENVRDLPRRNGLPEALRRELKMEEYRHDAMLDAAMEAEDDDAASR